MHKASMKDLFRLVFLSETNPHYRLAVVDTQHAIGFQEEADYMLIVSMEGDEIEEEQ